MNYEKDISDFCGDGHAVVARVCREERAVCQLARGLEYPRGAEREGGESGRAQVRRVRGSRGSDMHPKKVTVKKVTGVKLVTLFILILAVTQHIH